MRIFVAGATGAIGRRLVAQLLERGHEVVGTTRSPAKAEELREARAEAAVVDALDREALRAAVLAARPDAVVHELTALPPVLDLRRLAEAFAVTNRLRTEATDTLVDAAREAGAERIVAQSFAGWPYARTGSRVKTEDDALDTDPPGPLAPILDAIRHLEARVRDADGVVLRYGGLYGPGTSLAPKSPQLELVRRRRFPIVGDGEATWSFVHVDDAAAATVAALERGAPGIYNVVDDEPARVSEWLPALAELLGAKPPRRVPVWLARLVAGEAAVVLLNEARGASNAKARRELEWEPRYPSWREGFRAALRPERSSARTSATSPR
jgi:nucleoside-diphosphate-sugar epimerase